MASKKYKFDPEKLKSDIKAGFKSSQTDYSKKPTSNSKTSSNKTNTKKQVIGNDALSRNNPASFGKVSNERKPGQINALGAGDYGASKSTRFDKVINAAISGTASAYKKAAADVTSPTGNLSMGESAQAAINEAKTAKKEGRQVRPGQAQRKAEQEKIKRFNDGWAGDLKQKLLESAEESSKRAYEYEQEAKEGLGKFGQGVVDFGIAGAQFAGDLLLNAVAPGAGLAAMAGRAYGSASLDAQQRGLSEGEQQISGLKSAAIEMLTEKLFGSASKVAYGKGIIRNESLVNSLVNRLAKTDRGRTALKVLVGANEEGMEEVLSDILNPIADRILKLDDGKGDWSDLADDYDTQQMLEDYIIGGALGLVGAGTNVVSGQYRAENAQQRAYEEYQRQLVNAGLATEQGGDAQLTAEKYKNILDQSTQRGKRNLSDKETANLERLMTIGTDTQTVRDMLAQSGVLVDDNTAQAAALAASGQKLSSTQNAAIGNAAVQNAINQMAGNGVVDNIRRTAANEYSKPIVINSMARQYEVAPEVVERTYNLNPTAPQAFETAFNAVYQMGQQGTDKAVLSKVPVLSTAQANIAYQMGADSVMSTETTAPVTYNNTQEVNDNGVRIHNVAERINGQNTEGQIRGVETGTGENVAGGSQKEQGGAGAAQIKAGEKVSYNGKQQKGVYYAAEDTEDMKKGRKLAESYGYKVTYFVGGNIRYAGGEFRGAVDTAKKTVMVRADHPDYTAEQIMRHEMGHAAFENGDLSLNEAKEMLLDEFTADEINELIEIYSSEYGGILSADEAFEEICCDALGRMNIFEGTDLNSESYGKAQNTVRKYAADKTGSSGNNTIEASAAQQPNQKVGVNKAANASKGSIPNTSENVKKYSAEPTEGTDAKTELVEKQTLIDANTGKYIARNINGEHFGLTDDPSKAITEARDIERAWASTKFMRKKGITLETATVTREVQKREPYHPPKVDSAQRTQEKQRADDFEQSVKGSYFYSHSRKNLTPYYRVGNDVIINRTAAIELFVRAAKKMGALERHHSSRNGSKYSSSVYLVLDGTELRISDHELPYNAIRDNTRTRWDGEIILDDYTLREMVKLKSEKEYTEWVKECFENPERSDRTADYMPAFSREPERLNELRRQNEELKQRVEYWRNQTKPTTTKTVRKGDVQKLAREVIDMSDTDLKPGDITEGLSKLGEYILNEPELRYTDVAEMANSIASEVVENATAIVNEDDVEIHNDLKDYLKRVKFRDDGSTEFASVRRNYKRRIMFDKNGLGVDVAYAKLQNMFGEGYFPEDIINPGDMLERIAEVLDGTAPKYGNPNSYYSKEATEFLRNYIIDSMLGDQVRQTAPTYADKANAKLAETKADYNQRLRKQREEFNEKTTSIKEQNKQRVKEAISKERQRGEHRLQKFRDSVKERDTKRKETAEKSRYKKQIEKNVKTLSDWLLKPDHKNALKHIPGELQSTVRDFIASINFTSARQLGGGAATQKDMRYLSNLERLHRYITDSNVGEDRYSGYLDLPPNFDVELGNFIHEVNALARKNSGYTINDMTVEQLKELSDIVKTMKKTITDMNRMYQNKTFQHAYDAGAADVETLKGYVKTKAFTSNLATNRLDQTVMWEQSRPAHVFKRFGKGGESIYHEFADGQGTMAFLTKEVIDFSAETYKSEEVKAWAKETHTFEFGGDKVTLTTAQLMSLYELNKRTQAKQHIDSGGFRVANFKNGHFNLKTDKNSHRFTDIELGEMFSKLTDRQKEVADKLQRFMVEKGGAWGNYVSIKRFDVEMFKDENYFPIKVDDGQLDAKETESVDNASLYQLLNMGFAKDVSAKANQALVVYDIFDVFANHMAEMAQYRSFALPVLDAMKWFNYKERNESGAVTASLREEMRRAFGSDVNGRGFAEKFITGVIKAYNGAEGRGDNSLNSKMLNRVNRSAVAYNTRVMIQQPSAIVRAAMFLNPSDLAASLKNYVGITTKANIEEMHKYSGLAVWKDLGFYDVNVSRGVQELIKHSQGAVSKINEFGMKGAELADKVTWAALWDASKRKVSRETGLNKNDAEFFPKVVELFEDTVYNTQVVDTVLTKSELTRNKSFGVRLFTSFMSEPMTTASLVTSEIFDIQMKQAAGQKLGLSDYKRLSKTCVVVTLAAIVNSALAALADAWRDDDDYGTFGEKWTRALQVKLADELMPLTYFPFVSNVWDITKILLDDADKKWFGVAVYGNGTDIPLTDIVSSAEKALEIFQEIDEKGDKARYTKFGGYYKIVNILSKITGVPFYNATREIVTLHNILLPSDKWRSYEPKPENAIQFAWRDGYLTDEEALEYLQDEEIMGSEVLDEGKAWFALNKWKTGDTSDYTKLYEELDKSGDIKGAVDELREHGKEDGNIKGRVTDHFKDAYINGSSEEREKIRRAMYATGLYGSVNEVIEKCNDWLKKTK